jgi:hypothetical protein
MAGDDDDPSIDPFDDPRWLSWEKVHQLLWQEFGTPDVASLEMNEAFSWFVPTMVRSPLRWADRELKAFEFWNDHEIDWTGDRLVTIYYPAPPGQIDIIELAGYAWLPALAERWPTFFASMLPGSSPQKQPQKPLRDPEEWRSSLQTEFDRLERRQKSAWVRDKAFPRMQAEVGDKTRWKSWESLRRAFYSGRQKKI